MELSSFKNKKFLIFQKKKLSSCNMKKFFLYFWKLNFFMTVCSYHVKYKFQSDSTLYSCLNVKDLLARNRRDIWSLSDCSGTRTQNNLVRKGTLNHLTKLAKVFVYKLTAKLTNKLLQSLELFYILGNGNPEKILIFEERHIQKPSITELSLILGKVYSEPWCD